ncbi:MAG TPA: ABC transporter substrate-binding protein [Stellaceae bacterium]|nr:ABC transporter substrate-binding protein [Stellaceae bacterium]
MQDDAFQKDQAALLGERLRSGRISRRDFVAAAGLLGLTVSLPARAAAKELVLSCWGGGAVAAYADSFGKPFEKDTGIPVVIDSSGPSLGKIKAMVESGQVSWDICDSSAGSSETLGRAGLLEPIDYSIVDKTKTIPEFAMTWCYGTSAYSYVLAWDTKAVGATPPQTWADVWDLKKYPGKRTMRRSMHGVLESALLADGVPRDKIYPLDVQRGFDKLRQIKNDVIFWEAGTDSERLLREGEVVMGNVWSTRARSVEEQTKGRVTWTWKDGQITSGVFNVPKGNPAGKAAMQFLEAMNTPERQVMFLKLLGSGPANPAASPLVPPELHRLDPTFADNMAQQIIMSDAWYADHYAEVYPKFLDVISS